MFINIYSQQEAHMQEVPAAAYLSPVSFQSVMFSYPIHTTEHGAINPDRPTLGSEMELKELHSYYIQRCSLQPVVTYIVL